jgi:hypothetical protein
MGEAHEPKCQRHRRPQRELLLRSFETLDVLEQREVGSGTEGSALATEEQHPRLRRLSSRGQAVEQCEDVLSSQRIQALGSVEDDLDDLLAQSVELDGRTSCNERSLNQLTVTTDPV